MIIEPPSERPPKIFWRPIWRCRSCGRTMIFERGVNRWGGFYGERINICPKCDRRYADSLFDEESEETMTRFEEATQSPYDMAACIAFCIAGYLEGSGYQEFEDSNELIQFMTETSTDIVEWLNQESGSTE